MITYLHTIKALEYLLDKVVETRWRDWIREDIELWRTTQNVFHHLSAYGGMGSLNDLWISAHNRHAVMGFQEPWVNVALTLLRDLAFRLAGLQRKESKLIYKWFSGLRTFLRTCVVINGILQMTRKNLRLDGWRCSSCGYLETQADRVESFLARTVLPMEISRAKTESDLIYIVDMALSGASPEIQTMRDEINARIVNSGIAITDRQGWMRPCPHCGSNSTEVCTWIKRGRRFALRD